MLIALLLKLKVSIAISIRALIFKFLDFLIEYRLLMKMQYIYFSAKLNSTSISSLSNAISMFIHTSLLTIHKLMMILFALQFYEFTSVYVWWRKVKMYTCQIDFQTFLHHTQFYELLSMMMMMMCNLQISLPLLFKMIRFELKASPYFIVVISIHYFFISSV